MGCREHLLMVTEQELVRGIFLAANERNMFFQECENPFGECQGLGNQDFAMD